MKEARNQRSRRSAPRGRDGIRVLLSSGVVAVLLTAYSLLTLHSLVPASSFALATVPGAPRPAFLTQADFLTRADSSQAASPEDPYLSFRVREWALRDGLPVPIQNVAQTPDGYLWITTFDGLVRFDGARFVRYTTANTPAFRSHDLVGLYVSHDGDLWTGGRDGWVYRLRDGAWTAYDLTDILPKHWVQGFAEDADGMLWMVSTGPIVARFDGTSWTRVSQQIRDVWTPLVADANGTIWTMLEKDSTAGASRSDLGDGIVARWDGKRFVPVEEDRLLGFTATQHGPLLHRLADPKAAQASRGRVRVTLTRADGTPCGWYWTRRDYPAYARLVDRSGRVWVQRWNGSTLGMITVERDGVELDRFTPAGGTWVEQVFEDRQGSVWMHSRSSGLLQIHEEPFRRFTTDDGVPRFSLRAEETADGTILVSTEAAVRGPTVAEIGSGSVTPRTYRLDPAPGAPMRDARNGTVDVGHVMEDPRGRRWGLTEHALVRLEAGRAAPVWNSGAEELWMLHAEDDAPDVLWMGSKQGTVYRFDVSRRVVTDSLRVSGRVYLVHRGPQGRRWVGTEDGLWVVEDTGRLRRIPEVEGQRVRDLMNGPDEALWIATAGGGLLRWREGTARTLGTENGLPTDHLSAVEVDAFGFLWLSGRQALHRLPLAAANAVLDGRSSQLPVVDLLPAVGHLGSSNKLTHIAHARDGSLWFPSFKGVTRVDPARYMRQYDEALPVHVESIGTEQGSTLTPADGLRLPKGERTVTIRYTALGLRTPSLVRFRTRLLGRDVAWTDRGTARTATYGGLPPRDYRFQVQAMNAGGVWQSVVSAPAFTVPPRFTETWGFAVLCALGIFGLVVGAYRLRVRHLTKRQRVLNALVDERTRQLQAEKETVLAQADTLRSLDRAKSRVFANVSHEFRTPLTLTLGPLDDLKAGLYGPLPTPMAEQVDLARRNAHRVLDLVNQLLDVSRLEAGQVRLRARRVDLDAFARDVAQTFTPMAERKAIDLTTAPLQTKKFSRSDGTTDPASMVWVNPEHLQKILANLLSNALKFTPEGGSVRVQVTRRPETCTVSVRDSGPGIPADDVPHVFDRFFRGEDAMSPAQVGSGIGLALTKELVELHRGTISVESDEGFGSRFIVTFLRGHDHLSPDEIDAETPLLIGLPDFQDENFREDGAVPLVDAPGPGSAMGPGLEGDLDRGEDDVSTDAAGDRITVLLVEDNADVRAYVRKHLARSYRVIEASNGVEGMARAREAMPDLILSDVMMPEMDGVDLCRTLKSDPATDFIPFVLLTARAEEDNRLDALGVGADDYLTKPFNVDELRARIDNLIQSRKHLRERFSGPPLTIEAHAVEASSMDQQFIERVQSVVEKRLADEDFSVDDLAEAVGISRAHLYRRLQELLDESPSSLIRSIRLERAAQLLEQRAGTVSEIAYNVGFKSLSHFSRSFRMHFGHVPSEHAARAERAVSSESHAD